MSLTGSPLGPLGEAMLARAAGDATLLALAPGGIQTAVPRRTATTFPYVTLGQRQEYLDGPGASVRTEGGQLTTWIDVWSVQNGPAEVRAILSRLRVLFQHEPLSVAGFVVMCRSLHCAEELILPDVDPDIPERSLYRGIQQWVALVEEAA